MSIIIVLTIIIIICISFLVSQKFTDYFTGNQTNNEFLSRTLGIYLSFILLIYTGFLLYDIPYIRKDFFKEGNDALLLILSSANIIVYIIFPLSYFLIKNTNSSGQHKSENQVDYKNFTMKFSSYLFLYGLLNLIYLIYYKSYSIDYSYLNFSNQVVPSVLRKYSVIASNFEILTFFNFGMTITLGKIIMFTYFPFGMAKVLQNFLEVKFESKLELTERNSFENIEIFIQNFLWNIWVTIGFLIIFTLVITKIVIVWSKLSNNICGVDCGLLSFRYDNNNITFQNLLFYFQNYSAIHIFLFIFTLSFRYYTMITSLKAKGIALFLHNFHDCKKISSDKILALLYFSIFFILNIIFFYDMTYVAPDYVRFFTLPKKCDFLQIDSPDCGITLYGAFYIKFSLNFIGFIYFDILASFIFIFSSSIWLFILPINTLSQSFLNWVDPWINRFNQLIKIKD